MLKRKTYVQAPVHYDYPEALAWAAGWNHAIETNGTPPRITPKNVSERGIRAYLLLGGLFNPELANHQAVRDLLIDARDVIDAFKAIANR